VAAKGFGLFSLGACDAGSQIFTDQPLFIVQHTGNRRVARVCANCCAFVGSLQGQMEALFGEARFAPFLGSVADLVHRYDAEWLASGGGAATATVRCSQGCGEVYCSEACRDMHYKHSHNLLCAGPIDREDHPLLQFKYHALEHTDTLLLVAQVLAHIVNRAKASGGGAEATRGLMSEILGFCHAPFQQACRAPPGRGKDAEFLAHTDGLINTAATLLKAAFELHAPAEAAALFEHGPAFLSEVLGLFEYNNIDVEVKSPLGPLFAARVPALLAAAGTNPQAAAELALVERILREKEFVMRCVWGEETTGIYGDDEDAESEGTMADGDTAMGLEPEGMGDDGRTEEAVVGAAMVEARTEADTMTLEQLLAAPWPALHGTALFASVARMNHSCAPNVKIDFPMDKAHLVAVTLAPLAPGAELCISYIRQDADVKVRRRQLFEYGFSCNCERCLREDSAGLRKSQKRLK